MAVQEQTPIIEYIANGSTNIFPITFDIHSTEDLGVLINGELALEASYQVQDNSVIFMVMPPSGSAVTLFRDTEKKRLTDYKSYDNSFRPSAINWDLDKLWHVLQEQNLVDAKILARLKTEIEWRRTHDFNYDELAQVREKQIFDSLLGYSNTLFASTTPNVFEGVTAGVVFALDKKSVQTHLNKIATDLEEIRFNLLKAEENSSQAVTKEESRARYAEENLNSKIDDESSRAQSIEENLQNQVNAIGVGNKAYLTYALMDADKANIPAKSKVTVTNDATASNNGDWQWDGAAFTKSAYDSLTQAKNYTDAALPISKYGNLYNIANNVSGVYINSGGTVTTEANSILAIVPVEAGKTYAVKASSFASSYFFVGLKANNNTAAGQTSTIATLAATSDATVKTYIVPVGSTAKFALINVKVASSFDIRTGFVVNEGTSITSTDPSEETVQKIRGANVADVKAREEIKQIKAQPYIAESDLTVQRSGNLFSQSTSGYYITIGTGNFTVNADSAVGFFPIEAGKTYAIKPGNFNASYFSIMLKADNVVGSGTGTNATGMLVATSDPTVKTLTVPADSTAKFALLNVKVATSFDIRSTLVVNEGTAITDTSPYKSEITKIKGSEFQDLGARQLIEAVDEKASASIISPLKDKKWVVIGDSITEVNFRTNKNYHAYVSDNVGGMTVYNYGQSGSGYYGRFNVASTVTQDPDYLTVFFGTNDWQNSDAGNTKLLGTFGDTDNITIAGCVYLCLSQLVSKFYNKRIAVFTPLPRSDNYGSNAAPNSRGFTLEQLAKVIKQTADHLSIPCLDLYHESNLPVWVYAGNQFYFTPPTGGSADGLHPNDAGHQILARKVQKFLESI